MNIPPRFSEFLKEIAYPYRWWFIAMIFVGVYSSFHSVIQPYVLKILIDRASKSNSSNFISQCLMPGLILIVMSLIITMLWRFYNYVVLKSLPKIKADITSIATNHLRGQSYSYFQDNLSGSLSANILDLTSNIQPLLNTIFNISRQTLTIILSIGMAAVVNVYFSIAFFVISIAFLIIARYCADSIKPYATHFAQSRAKNSGNIVDCFSNVLSMILFAREDYESQYLEKLTNDVVEKDQTMQIKNMINASVLGGFAWILQAVSISLLLFLGSKNLITVGDFALIFILSITVIDQIWYLTESLLSIGETIGIYQNALTKIFAEHQQPKLPYSKQLKLEQGEIVFDNVTFGYPNNSPIFNNLSVTIPGGKRIGLVGYSGAGKSTFVSLITGLFDSLNGDIIIDGQPIKSISKESLRGHISFIPQTPDLFHRSIYENIQYGKIESRYEEVIKAAKQSFSHEFIENLPNKYNTIVGEKGAKLSGGQKQRIVIARAILKDAPILILDEATSSLDSLTESYIQSSLKTAMANKTVIVIAHRLSTVLSMDTILVLHHGQIIESGNHEELLQANGYYKQLWDSQRGHSSI